MVLLDRIWTFVPVVLSLFGQSAFATEDSFVAKKTTSGTTYRKLKTLIGRPHQDTRKYTGIELENGLRAILVSDPTAKMSSASLKIDVGTMDGPKGILGLPHLMEHIITKGSKKYPDPRELVETVKKDFGIYNAVTKYDTTTYYYEMSNNGFADSLDVLSQGFIAPLFHQDSVDSEITAVESEFKLRIGRSTFRSAYVQGKFSEPDHPFSWFAIGNEKSLRDIPKVNGLDTREALVNFFEEKYSANLMNLAIVSNLPMKKIKELVVEKFSGVKNLNRKRSKHTGPVLREKDKSILINAAVPHSESFLHVQFELPTQKKDYRCVPMHVINYYIEYEGPGSLSNLLKEKRLATKIISEANHNYDGFAILDIQFGLTQAGIEKKEEILEHLFKLLHLVKAKGITKKQVKKLKKLGEMKLKFGELKTGLELTEDLVKRMDHSTPLSKTLWPKEYPTTFNKDAIEETLSLLNPRNMRLTFLSSSNKDLPKLKVEPWSDTEYTSERLDKKLIENLEKILMSDNTDDDSGLSLPRTSQHFPTKIELVDPKLNTGHPVVIYKTKTSLIWHTVGKIPGLKASISIMICNSKATKSAKNSAYRTFLYNLFNAQIVQQIYEGEINEIETSLAEEACGISIKVTGYSQYLGGHINKLIKSIKELGVDEGLLANLIEAHRLDLDDKRFYPLYDQSKEYIEQAFLEGAWTTSAVENVLEKITFPSFTKYFNNFFKFAKIRMLAVGNITPEKAIGIVKKIKKSFKLKPVSEQQQTTPQKSISLPRGKDWQCNVLLNNEDANQQSAIAYFLNTNEFYDSNTQAYLALVGLTIGDFALKVLREQMELGYFIASEVRKVGKETGIAIFVQSDHLPNKLDTSIETMLSEYYDTISTLEEEQFDSLKTSVIDFVRSKSIRQVAQLRDHYWGAIVDQSYIFDHEDKLLQYLEEVTQRGFKKVLKANILSDSTSRRKFTINMFASGHKEPFEEANAKNGKIIIQDLDHWKEKLLDN